MYYDFSFCDDISPYYKELEILADIIPTNSIVVPNAKSMPFSFALSKNKKVTACFEEKRYLFMLLAFAEEPRRFSAHLKTMVPFDESYLNFAMNNNRDIDPWNQAILFYSLHYFSKQLCSFDGHIDKLSLVNKRRFNIKYQEPTTGFKLYEFPQPDQELEAGSLVITNRIMNSLDLLFEDKLKIYGA